MSHTAMKPADHAASAWLVSQYMIWRLSASRLTSDVCPELTCRRYRIVDFRSVSGVLGSPDSAQGTLVVLRARLEHVQGLKPLGIAYPR